MGPPLSFARDLPVITAEPRVLCPFLFFTKISRLSDERCRFQRNAADRAIVRGRHASQASQGVKCTDIGEMGAIREGQSLSTLSMHMSTREVTMNI